MKTESKSTANPPNWKPVTTYQRSRSRDTRESCYWPTRFHRPQRSMTDYHGLYDPVHFSSSPFQQNIPVSHIWEHIPIIAQKCLF